MNPRERILKTINHELPDRIPVEFSARGEVVRGLMKYFGVDSESEVRKCLGVEGWAGYGVGVRWDEFNKKADSVLEGDGMYGGGRYIFHDDGTFEDAWGVRRRKGTDDIVEWVSGPLMDAKGPDEYDFPGVDRLNDDPNGAERVAKLKENHFVSGGIEMPFKTAWQLRGLENFLADYCLNPRFVEKLYEKIITLDAEIARRIARAGVDMLSIGGDIAMQDRVLMGPQRWREFDKPGLKYVIDEAKKIKPDLHVFIHTDGDIRSILPDLIEIGFDVINPIQPECMDPVEIKRLYGDKITLHGTGSCQWTLPFGTPDDVRSEVTHRIENCGYNGGLILRPSNHIMFDTPVENVVAFYQTVLDYDYVALRERVDAGEIPTWQK